MSVPTIGRLSEEILKLLSGGDIQAASNISQNEIKIAIGQVCNQLLKTEHIAINEKLGEKIPNGSVVATYDGIATLSTTNGKSKAVLPIKPLKLPRNIGIFSVYLTNYPDDEFIPLQMGQLALIKTQPMINEVLGQTSYENYGMELSFNKDLPLLFPSETITIRAVVTDISQLDDYDPLPIPPEMEWTIKQEVLKLYGAEGISDLLVDATTKQQQNTAVKQQSQN